MLEDRSTGSRLVELRRRRGLSAVAVAKMLGCSVSSLFLWESGRELPRARYLRRLSEIYRVPLEELLV